MPAVAKEREPPNLISALGDKSEAGARGQWRRAYHTPPPVNASALPAHTAPRSPLGRSWGTCTEMTDLFDNEVFRAYTTYATIALVKMMLMSTYTAYFRITRKAFANPEDAAMRGKGDSAKQLLRTDPDVERVRRCHLNDLENIVPFIGIGLLYSLSGPDVYTALLHFRIFVVSRIFHSIAYLTPLPQPSRGLAFFAGFATTLSMAYRLLRIVWYL